MPFADLFYEGLKLLLIGMTSVFTFLGILVVAVRQMSRFVQIHEQSRMNSIPDLGTIAESPPSDPDEGRLAAIAAAIHRYRAARGR